MIESIKDYRVDKVIHESITFCFLFLALSAGLGMSIDKIAVIILLFHVGLFINFRASFNYSKVVLLLLVFSFIILTSLFNQTFRVMVFYPVFGILLVFTFLEHKEYLNVLKNVLFCYIIISFIGTILAYLMGSNIFVTSLATKGFPFIKPTVGLTTTVQTYGSICILWLIWYLNSSKKVINFQFIIVSLAILLTFNRSTYLFYVVVMSLYSKRFLFFIICSFLTIYAILFESINSFIFNQSSITSRSELLQGFYISFWNENSFLGYLLGKADNFYSPIVLQQVKWGHRPDIENLYAMLLHTYGFIGVVFYILSIIILLLYLFLRRNYRLLFVAAFYFFVTQYFTQEIVTNVFYLFLSVILLIDNYKIENSSN